MSIQSVYGIGDLTRVFEDANSQKNCEITGSFQNQVMTQVHANVADGATVAHGFGVTPYAVNVTGTVAGEIVTVTAKDAMNITVAIKKHDGTAGTAQTIYAKYRV